MRRLVLLALLAPASPAFADCVGTTLLSCDVGRGRHLEVCIEAGARAFAYAFGPAGVFPPPFFFLMIARASLAQLRASILPILSGSRPSRSAAKATASISEQVWL